MSALERDIAALITSEGPISLERYMALALGHPRHGYYMTRDPFGAAGDFITAPEISQMFGELLGLWAADTWDAMGQPPSLHLVELGPGRGTMMADALRALQAVPAFRAAAQVWLVETSPVLRQAQQQRLAHSGLTIGWLERIEEIPQGPAIILANEFFDALPVRHYMRDAQGWRERLVGLDGAGRLAFGLSREPEPAVTVAANEGAMLELSPAAHGIMRALAARLAVQGGAMLAIDYGHVETQLGETLQALKNHRYVDPLAEPGEADLTTHVDFAALARTARAAGAAVHGPLTQGEFLVSLGINERGEALRRRASTEQAAALDAALARLTGADRHGMGTLFKAMAVADPRMRKPAGFGY